MSVNDLVLPVQKFSQGNGELERNFRAIQDWAQSPHRTFGSRMVSPAYDAMLDTIDAFTVKGTTSGTFGTGVWDGVTIELDRRSRAFVWGWVEFANTDGADDYHLHFYLPVAIGAAVSAGQAMREFVNHNGNKEVIANGRSIYLDVTERKTVTFQWAFQNGSGSNQNGTVYRRRMFVAIYDAPDVDPNAEIEWTRSIVTQEAYRNQTADDSL